MMDEQNFEPIFDRNGTRYRLMGVSEMAGCYTKQAVYNKVKRGTLPPGVLRFPIGKTTIFAVPIQDERE